MYVCSKVLLLQVDIAEQTSTDGEGDQPPTPSMPDPQALMLTGEADAEKAAAAQLDPSPSDGHSPPSALDASDSSPVQGHVPDCIVSNVEASSLDSSAMKAHTADSCQPLDCASDAGSLGITSTDKGNTAAVSEAVSQQLETVADKAPM